MTEVCSSPAAQQKREESVCVSGTLSVSPSSCREEHLQEQKQLPATSESSGASGKTSKPASSIRRPSGVKRSATTQDGDLTERQQLFNAKLGNKRFRFLPPKKFLLGGNIRDPLNLNSIPEFGPSGTTPAQSPRDSNPSSPRLGPVEIKIPRWSRDPLNLRTESHSVGRKKRKRRDSWKVTDFFEGTEEDVGSLSDSELHVPAAPADTRNNPLLSPEFPPLKRPRCLSLEKRPPYDPIVSPVSEKPPSLSTGSPQKLRPSSPVKKSTKESEETKVTSDAEKNLSNRAKARKEREKKFNPNAARFRFGNYNRYYGKRLPEKEEDARLKHFKREWIEGKTVLDVGCNIGHVTMILAREFGPKKIVGMDIDGALIGVARKNVRHYLDKVSSGGKEDKFPTSFSKEYGPISGPPIPSGSGDSSKGFPGNLIFKQGNYVLDTDSLLEMVKPEYDAVVALSVTKWVHLNWGDAGLKRFFRRTYRNLNPGGILILEPQPFSSYKKRKKLTPEILENFQQIALKPEKFKEFLLSDDVGFESCETVGVPASKIKGFQRPLLLFRKGEASRDCSSSQKKKDDKSSKKSSETVEQSVCQSVEERREPRDLNN